ncbi:hypothetical protein NDQ41_05460 [Alcaligenes faecalis]|uniref:hypothetical protein n=1 Tax=Alcaligenes faecalis TaxID=511 RepID=UPI00203E58F1|nr:hypothetical protein [Alcaligenes faecalis]
MKFWTPENIEHAQALRWCRRLWAPLPTHEQWRLECMTYRMRGNGMSGQQIARTIQSIMEHRRPWRMSDAKLGGVLSRRRKSCPLV